MAKRHSRKEILNAQRRQNQQNKNGQNQGASMRNEGKPRNR